jgi:putative oxidoreductase
MAIADSQPSRIIPGFSAIYDCAAPVTYALLRAGLGIILIPHGMQKLFGSFGGMGLNGFAALFDKLGYSPGMFWTWVVGGTEFIGGILLVLGLFTRISAAAQVIFMINAIWFTANSAGFFWTKGGMEYPLLIGLTALYVLARGGGPYSLDRRIGREF